MATNNTKGETMTTKFETGKAYTATSVCDHNCKWTFEVVRRTAASVWLRDDRGNVARKSIKIYNDCETCYPLGKYSMAPILRSGN